MKKKTLYIDLDGVLADYDRVRYDERYDEGKEGFFLSMKPVRGAIKAWNKIIANSDEFDTYIASTAPWSNPDAWKEKRLWVEKYLGDTAFKRLILTHNKGLLKGDILIDDRLKNGVIEFEGEHIFFGSYQFPDWEAVLEWLGL